MAQWLQYGTFLGYSFTETAFSPPAPSAFTGVKLYGGNAGQKVSSLQIRNIVLTESEANAIDPTVAPIWDINTIFMATFQDSDLNAGNVTNITEPIASWDINRIEVGKTQAENLANVDVSTTSYIDWTTEGNNTYQYQIVPLTENQVGQQLLSEEVNTDYFGFFLIDEDTGLAFKFDVNINSGTITTEDSVTEYQNFGKYNTFNFGERKFDRGTLRFTYAPNICQCDYSQSISEVEALKAFITNGKEKILKTRKGEVYRVVTFGFQRNQLNDAIGAQPYDASFSWAEVREV